MNIGVGAVGFGVLDMSPQNDEASRSSRLQQQAEMGRVAAGLAHEIKNPLSTLKLNLQLLQEDLAELPGAEVSRNRAATLWRVADRLTQTLDDFLRYAGRLEIRPQAVPINQLIEETVDFIQGQAQALKVRIHTALTPENPKVQIDPQLVKQALFNIMINGIQAISPPQGNAGGNDGSAEVSKTATEIPEGDLIIRTQLGPQSAIIDISDTGPGIPKENLEHIFEAYYTTKKGGTGLGLPIALRIVEEHHGHLTVTSEVGQGTNFRMEFPLIPPTQVK